MYFFPVFMLRLLVEEVIRSFFSVSGEEEGTIMDWDITLLAGAALGVVGEGSIPAIISPVITTSILLGTNVQLHLSIAHTVILHGLLVGVHAGDLVEEEHEVDEEGDDESEELDLEEVPGQQTGELGHVFLHVE